jgi:hypothetical protein
MQEHVASISLIKYCYAAAIYGVYEKVGTYILLRLQHNLFCTVCY